MIRVSDYIVDYLQSIETTPAFLLSGGGMMHLIDALAKAGMPYVCCHHEQAAAMAAEAAARVTGRLGVCYATSGPGATNILTGLVGAWQDSAPVLFLTGQSKRSQTIRSAPMPGLRQFGTFEVDIVPIVSSVTKFSYFLDDPADVRWVLEKAVHLATTGRPGPVLIDVPLDVQGALIDPATLQGYERPRQLAISQSGVASVVAEKIRSAMRPIILAGHGVRCGAAIDQLRAVVRKLRIPVVTTQLGKDALPYEDPLFVGHSGPKGDRAGNFAIQAADLILSVGSSLHAQTIGYEADLFAPGAFKIQVDIEKPILNRGDVPVDMQIEMDVGEFLTLLGAEPNAAASHDDWIELCAGWKERFAVRLEPHDVSTDEINFYELADALSHVLRGSEIVVTDAGSAFYVLGQAFRCRPDQRYIVSGALGAMGYSLPAAIGAAAASLGRTVICITGDGSLQTNIHELQTLAHHGFNVKVVVVENDGYASIRNTQLGFFKGRLIGASPDSGVSIPPVAKISEAYGLPFLLINDRSKMVDQLITAIAEEGPYMIGVRAQPKQVIIPTVSSRQLPGGGLRSNPLHIMHPLLDPELIERELGALLPVGTLGAVE